ncbi:SCO family protein [Aurantibacillus circumpalustris]|uniref:SCO family protein n=1 Tax=Aurantibacillus circumpalustris TaxID=3036359 RepID=UPI00295A5FF6|nr:SCO family protein [Aurantibacillus circumpalustris]
MKCFRILLLSASLMLVRCNTSEEQKLPVLGNPIIVDGKSVYPKISKFSFINQENQTVNSSDFEGKVYVADFIFLSCSTICPLMNIEMLKVYTAFNDDKRVLFLSHTIDPKRDSIYKLNEFAKNLGVSSKKWYFVTGNEDSIYKMAERDYFTIAYPDSTETDGLVHGGGLLLIDKNKNIRGVYNGTESSETERLIADIKLLLKEQF